MQVQGFCMRVRLAVISPTGSFSLASFVVARYVLEDSAPTHDMSNSECVLGTDTNPPDFNGSPPAVVSRSPGTPGGTIELEQATLITNAGANPFLAPFSLRSGMKVRVEIYPNRAHPYRHSFPVCLLSSVSQEGMVSSLQPVTLKMETDGPYYLYSS